MCSGRQRAGSRDRGLLAMTVATRSNDSRVPGPALCQGVRRTTSPPPPRLGV